MAAIECGRGHLYDPDIYASCPYCNSAQPVINFGGVPVGDAGKTAPIGGGPAAGGGGAPFVPGQEQAVVNDGKTMPPKGYQTQRKVDEENKTLGFMQEKLGLDPVVGWLVCIEGKEKGKDYKLRGQINTIGRSEKMDVCIRGDKTISSENHARLSYSEKNNRFKLIPAESRNIIYLNGEEVFAAEPLAAYDVIDFGETKLMFLPFCSERFTWSEAGEKKADGNGDGAV
ncbi:hypothetical protein CE91St41_33150 [Oscillospiraceae bacterium]|nr:hypothetical protein CE91St40_33140 [Oscillospiraceae bacterium]BDF76426.1 hypothetical protein CE91St41_33150 [Oscillospiraceae bacterium]